MKRILLALIVLLALGGGGYLLLGGKSKPPQYRFEVVDRGDIVVSISATGTLSAVTTVSVGSQVSGTIASLHADFNSTVRKGQLLAQLDPTFLQATVKEQRANLDRAAAQRSDAERTWARLNQLHDQKLVSQADLDAAVTARETSEASLRQAQAALDRAEVNLRYATITSPIDGVVISRSVDVGQTVAASLSAPVLFTIAQDLTRMQVQASVTEADIGQVAVGQPVTFRVDAYPNEQFNGAVSQVRLAPVIVQNVVTYQVIVGVDNSSLKLMPGMTATITIEAARQNNVLRLPVAALRFMPAGFSAGMSGTAGGFAGREGMPSANPRMADSMKDSARARFRDLPDSVRAKMRAEGEHGWGKRGGDSSAWRGRMRADGHGSLASDTTKSMSEPMRQPGRIFRLVGDSLTMVRIMTGLSTSRYAELLTDKLKEGDSIVVGIEGGSATQAATTNPFAPQMPGGNRPGGGGGGMGGGRRQGF